MCWDLKVWQVWVNCFYCRFRDCVVFLKSILFIQLLQSHSPHSPVPEQCHNLKNSIHATETNFKVTQVLTLHFWIPWKGCIVSAVLFRILLCSFPLHLPTETIPPLEPQPLLKSSGPRHLVPFASASAPIYSWIATTENQEGGKVTFLGRKRGETISRFRQSPFSRQRKEKPGNTQGWCLVHYIPEGGTVLPEEGTSDTSDQATNIEEPQGLLTTGDDWGQFSSE